MKRIIAFSLMLILLMSTCLSAIAETFGPVKCKSGYAYKHYTVYCRNGKITVKQAPGEYTYQVRKNLVSKWNTKEGEYGTYTVSIHTTDYVKKLVARKTLSGSSVSFSSQDGLEKGKAYCVTVQYVQLTTQKNCSSILHPNYRNFVWKTAPEISIVN